MNRHFLLPLASGLWILASPGAHALTDTNANGFSDDWEKAFNNGQLFSAANPAHIPAADPDKDGWTNLQESTAGTNPFDPLPPVGYLVPSIAVTPATYEPLPAGSTPPPTEPPPTDPFTPTTITPGPPRILLDPTEVRLTWPTVPGKTYRADLSADLITWAQASSTFVGSGQAMTYDALPLHSDGSIPEKLFWRVAIGDTETDGDTISDYEEMLRGLNPLSTDTDRDGIPDNLDPQPQLNSLQATWDADATDPSGAALFAAFNFTPPTSGGYPFTAERVTDISGNTRHGKARMQSGGLPQSHNHPQQNAEGISNNGFHFANTHHFAFEVKSPVVSFSSAKSLSFWIKTKASDLAGVGQPIFCYVPQNADYNASGNSYNQFAIRAYLRNNPLAPGYEIVWLDWRNPGAVVRDRWLLSLSEKQIDGQWMNLSFVWKGQGSATDTSKNWLLYHNGNLQTRTHSLPTPTPFLNGAAAPAKQDTFLIGAVAAGGTAGDNLATVQSTFKGSMDRVRLHTTALSQLQVQAIVAQDADSDGLWDATEVSATAWKDTNSNSKRDPGEIFFPNGNPLHWQPSTTDTDSDDLTDIFEQNTTRTVFYNHDTDDDLLPDGWEHTYGLNPLSSAAHDGQTGDPDGDGLDNFDEWRFLSRPKAAPGQPNSTATDTDGDGTSDGAEKGQGTRPADPTDNGQVAALADKLTLKIIVGDPSSSNSERWRIEAEDIATGAVVLRHSSRLYGQMSTAAESTFDQFKPGKAYRFKLRHAGTDPAKLATDPEGTTYPDYDWSLQISYKDTQGNFINLSDPAQVTYAVIDPYNSLSKDITTAIPKLLATEQNFATIGVGSPGTLKYRYDMQFTQVAMLPLTITPDTNRDGKIDLADRGKVTSAKPWRFWTNDDDDSGETEGTDLPQPPGSEDTNGDDHKVNGMRDLIDFFPLDLDLKAALEIFPEGKYRYRLTHNAPQAAPCFKIVQARELHITDSDAYIRDLAVANSVKNLECAPIHAPGRYLDTRFLGAQAQGNGILLVEAIRPTAEPIKLSIIRKSDQSVMGEVSFPVSITPALDMVRWKFVTPGAADITANQIPASPPNWPDTDRSDRHFVFVHGYNVNPEQSKGWGTEAFKRMFWSGSNARFSVFAWYGYQSQIPPDYLLIGGLTPNYQINLINAFGTAKSFKEFVSLLDGQITVGAHSMGNILVGSAMHDWGSRPKNYLMLNSAAAKECYDGTETDDSDQDSRMIHPAWAAYHKTLRASEWHKLAWPTGDKRLTLTWKNRLRGVIDNGGSTDVYHFYSSGEEVLNNAATTDPAIDPANPFGVSDLLWTTANKTWAIQEKRKGYGLTGAVHTSNYGGWLPNLLPYHVDLHVTATGPWGTHRMRTQAELPPATDAAWLAKLRTRPFFNISNHPDLYTAQTGSGSPGSDYAQQHRNTIISEMIPCTTYAAGRNEFINPEETIPLARQFDMNTTMMTDASWWPYTEVFKENENDAPLRSWLHSDLRAKAYSHTWKLYDKFVEIGNLK